MKTLLQNFQQFAVLSSVMLLIIGFIPTVLLNGYSNTGIALITLSIIILAVSFSGDLVKFAKNLFTN